MSRLFMLLVFTTSLILAKQPIDASDILGVPTLAQEELERGMTGYGLTVFAGTEVERFEVEILDVLPNWWAGGDMILAELRHPAIEDLGVVAGMSGSPVYIDDKLIGAVAYGWPSSKRPIAGITPISKMEEIYDEITDKPRLSDIEWTEGLTHWPEANEAMTSKRDQYLELPDSVLRSLNLDDSGGPTGLRRLSTPLFISSVEPQTLNAINDAFRGAGFMPVQGGGGVSDLSVRDPKPEHADLEPENGGALGMVMIDGAFQMASIGTITFVDDERIMAYGHAATGVGDTDAPVAVAEIATVMPSSVFPFKLGYAVKEVGALRQDRQFGIGATRNARSNMIPMTVTVTSEVLTEKERFDFYLWNERRLVPTLAFLCMIEAGAALSKTGGAMTAMSDFTIELTDGNVIRQSDYRSGTGSMMIQNATALLQDLQALINNRFKPVSVKSINVTMDIQEQLNVMVLDHVVEKRTEVFPGQDVTGTVVYERYRKDDIRVPFSFSIPNDIEPGPYEIQIVDGPARTSIYQLEYPEKARIDSFEELVNTRQPNFPPNQIYFLLVGEQKRLIVDGQRQDDLPASVMKLTESTKRSGPTTYSANGKTIREERKSFPDQVIGRTTVRVTVKEPK